MALFCCTRQTHISIWYIWPIWAKKTLLFAWIFRKAQRFEYTRFSNLFIPFFVLFFFIFKYFGFKDTLKYANVVACLNLKHTRKREFSRFPCLFATELSFFTQKSFNCKFMSSEFNSLNEMLNANKAKLGEVLKKLETEIEECKNRGPIRSNRTSDTFIIRHKSTGLLNPNSSFNCLNESMKSDVSFKWNLKWLFLLLNDNSIIFHFMTGFSKTDE